jgi:hypothetical protein
MTDRMTEGFGRETVAVCHGRALHSTGSRGLSSGGAPNRSLHCLPAAGERPVSKWQTRFRCCGVRPFITRIVLQKIVVEAKRATVCVASLDAWSDILVTSREPGRVRCLDWATSLSSKPVSVRDYAPSA